MLGRNETCSKNLNEQEEYSLGGGNSFNERELNLITNALMNFLQLLDIFNSILTSR